MPLPLRLLVLFGASLLGCAHAPREEGTSVIHVNSLAACRSRPDGPQQILRCGNLELGTREGVNGTLRDAYREWLELVRKSVPVAVTDREIELTLDGVSFLAIRFDLVDDNVVRSGGYFLLAPSRAGRRWVWCAADEARPRALGECRDDLAIVVKLAGAQEPEHVEQPMKL
jgi:hypothetical protein